MSYHERSSGAVLEREAAPKSRHLTYNADFDTRDYLKLEEYRRKDPDRYAQEKALTDARVTFNLQTMLGERYNAGISTRDDRILKGELVSAFSDEPLLTMYERGRDFRYKNSSAHDRQREQGEIDGFLKIRDVMLDPATKEGTMMVSVSPSGGEDSEYNHNFYDIFTLKQKEGKKIVEASRFSSALSDKEYIAQVANLSPQYFHNYRGVRETMPLDVYFLKNPFKLMPDTILPDAASVHDILHKNHNTLSQQALELIFEGTRSVRESYLMTLTERPWDIEERNLKYNAYLNRADELRTLLSDTSQGTVLFAPLLTEQVNEEEIRRLGRQTVREVTTGCGLSAGYVVGDGISISGIKEPSATGGNIMPYSVIDFGISRDLYGSLTFNCPHCNIENKRPFNTLLPNCGFCQGDVTC